MAPFVLGWVPPDAEPDKLASAAEGVLDHWKDPSRVTASVYVPNAPAQLLAALISLESARDGGKDTSAAITEALWLLAETASRLSASVGLGDAGVALESAYPEDEQTRVAAYAATVRALPAFVAARLPDETDKVLAADPKNVLALRARGRYELLRLDAAAALPFLDRLVIVSDDEADLLARTEAAVLSADRDADAKGAVSAFVRKVPEQAFSARYLLSRRDAYVAWHKAEASPPRSVGEALTRFADLCTATDTMVHTVVVDRVRAMVHDFPGPDSAAMQAGWLWAAGLQEPAMARYEALRGQPAVEPGAQAARLASGVMFALNQFATKGGDLSERLAEIERLAADMKTLTDFERGVTTTVVSLLRTIEGDAALKALGAKLIFDEAARRERGLPLVRGLLSELSTHFPTKSGPYVANLLVDTFADASAAADHLVETATATDDKLAVSERNRFDQAVAVIGLRAGTRFGRKDLLTFAEERARRVLERQTAFEDGIRKLPGASADICPPAGCASVAEAFAIVGAARNARRALTTEDERAELDSGTVKLMRRAERFLIDHGMTWSDKRAEVQSHRCLALINLGDNDAASLCASDLVDQHPDAPASALFRTALGAPVEERRADAVSSAEGVVDNAAAAPSLRFQALRWLAILEYATGHEEGAKRRAGEAKALRAELTRDGADAGLLNVVAFPAMNLGMYFNFKGTVTATFECAAQTMSVIRAPVDDLQLDGLLDGAAGSPP